MTLEEGIELGYRAFCLPCWDSGLARGVETYEYPTGDGDGGCFEVFDLREFGARWTFIGMVLEWATGMNHGYSGPEVDSYSCTNGNKSWAPHDPVAVVGWAEAVCQGHT